MKEKLFVISIDAMVREDIPYLETKPNFSKIMSKRAEVTEVYSVYPSLTYPAHVTLTTGCRPGRHGVYNNASPKTYADGIVHFHLNHKMIRAEDIFSVSKRAGCTTAAVYWPISGGNPNIDYNINEYFFYYPNEPVEETFARMGANENALGAVRESMHRFPVTKDSGNLDIESTFDDFIVGCTCALIRNEQPDVMLIHVCDVDSLRHQYGVFSPQAKEGLDRMDNWLGEIVSTMKEAGIYEDTNFVILSDHGQMDARQHVSLNALLVRGGFVELAPDGTIYDWQAWVKCNGMSASIHLKDKEDSVLYQQVYAYLKQLVNEGCWGIEKVYTEEDARNRYGTYGAFSFMVEGDGKTLFNEEWKGPAVLLVEGEEFPGYRSTHGYEPEKGPKPVFMGRGPAFREDAVVPSAQLIDIAPTLARILGQELPRAEGRCLEELLR